MAKTKSMAQIVSQANRIHHSLYEGNFAGDEFTGSNAKRMEHVMEIMWRYDKNVCKHFNHINYMSNEEFNTQLERSVYMGF